MADGKVLFKKGLASSIPEQKDPGSIIIATDTGEMYLDDTSSIRIQIKDSTKLPLSGGTMTGNIDIDNHKIVNVPTPSDASDAVPKSFVDTAFTTLEGELTSTLQGYLSLKGGTMSGPIDMTDSKITSSYSPTSNNDLVNKQYVDTEVASVKIDVGQEPIPGNVPSDWTKIGSYVIYGDTTVSDGNFVSTKGKVTIGSQEIQLPELNKFDTLIASSDGTGLIIRATNTVRLDSYDSWLISKSSFNPDEAMFVQSNSEISIGSHENEIPATDMICNVLPTVSYTGQGSIQSNPRTEGIAIRKQGNGIVLHVSKQSQLDAGVSSEDVNTSNGIKQWFTAKNAIMMYKTTSPTYEIVSLSELTSNSGEVSITGSYSGGTISSYSSISDTQNKVQILSAQMKDLKIIDSGSLTYPE